MKDLNELLSQKEAELLRIQKEVEALKLVAKMLTEEAQATTAPLKATGTNGAEPAVMRQTNKQFL